jgi:hypothetical protein
METETSSIADTIPSYEGFLLHVHPSPLTLAHPTQNFQGHLTQNNIQRAGITKNKSILDF